MMKSSRGRVRTSSRQNASTLGVWRRSSPKISRRCPQFAEIRLRRIAPGRVAREARGDDQLGSGAQQLEPGLITDLHASAGQQRNASAQVGQFRALGEVEFRAHGAHLIVEMVDDRKLLLADVAMLRLDRFPKLRPGFESLGRKEILSRENRPPAEHSNPCLAEHGIGAPGLRGRLLALAGLQHPAAGGGVGKIHLRHGLVKSLPLFGGELLQQLHVGGDGFEHLQGRA